MEEKIEEKDNNTTKNHDEIYCVSCGKIIKKEAFVCPHCGVKNKAEANKKNKNTAGLLAIFLGSIGVHKFYLGKNGEAVLRIGISVVCVVTAMVACVNYMTNVTKVLMNTPTFDLNTIAELSNPMSLFNPLFLLIYIPSLLGIIDGIRLFSMSDDAFHNMTSNTNKEQTNISNFFVDILGVVIIVIIIMVSTIDTTNISSNLSLEEAIEMHDGGIYVYSIKELVSKDINAIDNRGYTALNMASREGYVEIVEALINEGADTEIKDDISGWSPLLSATGYGHIEVLKMLIEAGADINTQANSGVTALIHVSEVGQKEQTLEMATLLALNGADVNIKNNQGITALMHASRNGLTEIVKLLVDNGVDLNAKNNFGTTALVWASSQGHPEIVEILKAAGARE